MFRKTKLYSILLGKCPRCHKGHFFDGTFFKGTPKKECDHCGLKYEREPGFFQGSYYVVYALGVATLVTSFVACSILFPEMDYINIMWITLIAILVLTPFLYPLSKIIWSNFFTSYDENIANK